MIKLSRKKVAVLQTADDSEAALAMADLALMPAANAAAVIKEYSQAFGKQDLQALSESLADTMTEVHDGNLASCEAMLIGQAQALQSIFVNLSRQAINREYIPHCESLLRLALKAQNQCRSTIETLATIKNPPVVYAQQANISQGHQQINNCSEISSIKTCSGILTQKNKNNTNELLENRNEEWLDSRTTQTTSNYDTSLEALATINRSKNH